MPLAITASSPFANPQPAFMNSIERPVKLFGDGEMFEPDEYLEELKQANAHSKIIKDRYGVGGVVEALEKTFATVTGKEKAVFLPSGTMANQLAIAVLSGDKPKVYVQDESHVYRDEADAAQEVFHKRLMPLAKGKAWFTATELEESISRLKEEEVFITGVGALSLESPVRRQQGRMVPLSEIRKISDFCRSNNIRLHLDGARIYMASAWSGISIKEYASFFDTIYISLYKYLGASGGAILCGDKAVIDQIPHQIKVHGGSMYGNWTNAAMALHRLEGLETRLQLARQRADALFVQLNKLGSIRVEPISDGTNIYELKLEPSIDRKKFHSSMTSKFNIRLGMPNEKNESLIWVNETLLYRPLEAMLEAFRQSVVKG